MFSPSWRCQDSAQGGERDLGVDLYEPPLVPRNLRVVSVVLDVELPAGGVQAFGGERPGLRLIQQPRAVELRDRTRQPIWSDGGSGAVELIHQRQ